MKSHLRQQIKTKRQQMLPTEVQQKSHDIINRLQDSDLYKSSCTILFYVSYNNEVSTHTFIQQALKAQKKVIVPCSNIRDSTLSLFILTQWSQLEHGAYSILEPKKTCISFSSLDILDLVLVPGVVFDIKGNRIGHGKGYYDRLLQKVTAPRIGLAYDFQVVDTIPADPHDQKVDYIITESRSIKCKN